MMTFDEILDYKPDECKECTYTDCDGCLSGSLAFQQVGENNYEFVGICNDPQKFFHNNSNT